MEEDIDDFKVGVLCEVSQLIGLAERDELDKAGLVEGLQELCIRIVEDT